MPTGFTAASTGVVSDSSFSRFRSSFSPSRPAIAARWITPLVEPPSASSTRTALSTAPCVMILSGVRSERASATARTPVASAARSRSACTAGIAAVPGRIMPSASAIAAMVEAVPITAQVPAVVTSRPSTASISALPISPARNLVQNFRQSVQAPTRSSL